MVPKGETMDTLSRKEMAEILILLGQKVHAGKDLEKIKMILRSPDQFVHWDGLIYLSVDGETSIDEQIEKAEFDSVNSVRGSVPLFDSTARTGKMSVPVEFVEFDNIVSGQEAADRIIAKGKKNADIFAVLALALQYPMEQVRRPIAGLGAMWKKSDGKPGILCLTCYKAERQLSICSLEDTFEPRWRFLAIPSVSDAMDGVARIRFQG